MPRLACAPNSQIQARPGPTMCSIQQAQSGLPLISIPHPPSSPSAGLLDLPLTNTHRQPPSFHHHGHFIFIPLPCFDHTASFIPSLAPSHHHLTSTSTLISTDLISISRYTFQFHLHHPLHLIHLTQRLSSRCRCAAQNRARMQDKGVGAEMDKGEGAVM